MNASTVLVAEGEKDVLNLVNLGFVATCNPMGAKKWLPEYSDQLAGKDVVIFPDDDTPGREHVQQAGKSLVYKAKSMRVANVPAHDVSDWIEAGATADDIRAAIDSAAAFVPAGGDSEVAEVVDWRAGLLTNEKGFPKALLANAITALRDAPEWQGVLAFNEFSLVTVALKKLPWQSQEGGGKEIDKTKKIGSPRTGCSTKESWFPSRSPVKQCRPSRGGVLSILFATIWTGWPGTPLQELTLGSPSTWA